jgi:hypothetical protein
MTLQSVLLVGPRKAESQMAEEKRPKKRFLAFGRMLKWPKFAKSRSSGPPFARARSSPLDLDSANFTV